MRDFEELTLAHVMLSNKRSQEALEILDRLSAEAKKAGRGQTVLYAAALTRQIPGHEKCPENLKDAFSWAEREDFARVFLEAGLPVPASRHTPQAGKQGSQALVDQPEALFIPSALIEPAALIEPLSEREMEVLRLIAEGLTNPEIAARLYLSVNTLRAHTTNIFQKLDVHNRMAAVTKARQFGLLKEK